MPTPTIAELIQTTSDEELPGKLFSLILAHHGDGVKPKDLNVAERVVMSVYQCSGIIGNGGFRYLLEKRFHGDPELKYAYQAFDILGCPPANQAFRKTFAIFPDGHPPRDIAKRMKQYLKRISKWPTDEDILFINASKQIDKALVDFIRARPHAFVHINPDGEPPKSEIPKAKPKREEPYDDLPHWARVALAVHIAWDVFPLLRDHWPKIPSNSMAFIRVGIERAEQSSINGYAVDGLKDAAMKCVMTAGAALMMKGGESAPPDGIAATLASHIAKAAEFAVAAAMKTPQESARALSETITFAYDSIPKKSKDRFRKNLSRNYRALLRRAEEEGWTDDTSMPPNLWEVI